MTPFDELIEIGRGNMSPQRGVMPMVLRKIQRMHGLPQTGHVDERTLRFLQWVADCERPMERLFSMVGGRIRLGK